jgi:hypothetical protein
MYTIVSANEMRGFFPFGKLRVRMTISGDSSPSASSGSE